MLGRAKVGVGEGELGVNGVSEDQKFHINQYEILIFLVDCQSNYPG